MRVIVIAKPITLWAGAESLNKLVDRDEETLSSPVQWLGPHRTATWVAKPNRTIGRETLASLTYLNGCQAKTKRSIKGVEVSDQVTAKKTVTKLEPPAGVS